VKPSFRRTKFAWRGGLAAAELVGLQDPAQVVSTGQTDDGFRGVSLAAVDEFVAGGSAEGVVAAAVQVVQCLEDVFLL
jgi:hypothetical protein